MVEAKENSECDFGGADDADSTEAQTHSVSVGCGPDEPIGLLNRAQADAAIRRAQRKLEQKATRDALASEQRLRRPQVTLDSLFRDDFYMEGPIDSVAAGGTLKWTELPEDFCGIHLMNEEGAVFSFYQS